MFTYLVREKLIDVSLLPKTLQCWVDRCRRLQEQQRPVYVCYYSLGDL